MNEYEKKLLSFRKQQRKDKLLNQCKTYLWHRPISSLSSLANMVNPAQTTDQISDSAGDSADPLIENEDNDPDYDDYVDDDKSSPAELREVTEDITQNAVQNTFSWVKFAFSAVIWICLFAYSVYIQFGAVFFILSCFYFIWTNTRTSPKKANEISAYSVFNPNCERIEGTLDAKQLESEMLYGMMF